MKRNQLMEGMLIEKEHIGTFKALKRYHQKYKRFPTPKMFVRSIAKDHLKEDKNYYTKLKRARL